MILGGHLPWADLAPDVQTQFRGNLDPWTGPVDPEAQARALRDFQRRQDPRDVDPCGCFQTDCAECGARMADGHRPAKGHRRRWALRQDAAVQRAKEAYARG